MGFWGPLDLLCPGINNLMLKQNELASFHRPFLFLEKNYTNKNEFNTQVSIFLHNCLDSPRTMGAWGPQGMVVKFSVEN